ncbi:unnamed protein product [Ceratitis capitata]|uniref:(Mediterranean fruit fly) hypothetical protein n=1 Tax=Ceratitis capitata TaxID=7213 RepID=A0A811USD0_CERCA|nr:unnamed protein product [Ceratitis capitata]
MTHNTANCGTTFNKLAPIAPISKGLVVINDQLALIEENNEAPITINEYPTHQSSAMNSPSVVLQFTFCTG